MSKTIYLNQFDGGIVNDPRSGAENVARVVTNFDILTDVHKMTPYRDSESGDSSASTSKKQNFAIALRTGTTYSLYALGVVSGGGLAEVNYKNLTTGASTDLDDSGWTATANNASGSGSTSFNLFVYYKKTGLIYGARAGTYIWAYDPTGSAGFADTSHALSYTNICQGLVHSKDDILYVGYDNKIAKNDNGSWNVTALTLPSDLYITSISEHGNYLAIACAPLSGVGHSRVFLWDRDSSLATLSDSIDWGEEKLQVLEEVDGVLIGISLSGSNSTRFSDRIIFRYLNVSSAVKFAELLGGTSTQLPIAKQKINNRVYFMMQITLNGVTRQGVWSVGRNSQYSGFSIVHERTVNNDTDVNGDVLNNFFSVGDYMFIAYQQSSAFALSKTNDTASYTATSIWESTINPKMPLADRVLDKKLISVGATYEALPANGQIVVKYKVNGGSYETIFTETTDGVTRTEPVGVRASDSLPFTDGSEYEFRVESTGGAVFTGLQYRYDTNSSN